MIGLLPIHRVVVTIALVYAAIVAVAIWISSTFFAAPSFLSSVKIAVAGGTALNFALLAFIYFAWRSIWSWFPVLNTLLFPDLNGKWNMAIHWSGAGGSGAVVHASAVIKQDFIRISMEVHSPNSDSETLIAHPRKDPSSGTPILYYVYRVIPKQKHSESGSAYEGAAILRFSSSAADELRGNYFTSQHTKGYFSLTRATS